MLVKMESNGGGGGISIDDLDITGKTLLHTISSTGQSYTTTEDCVISGTLAGASGVSSGRIYASTDGGTTKSIMFWVVNNGSAAIGGGDGIYKYGVFVPKGTTIITENYGTYSINFYSVH